MKCEVLNESLESMLKYTIQKQKIICAELHVVMPCVWMVTPLYICKLKHFDVVCNISFSEHLPGDGHRFPKRVGGYDVRNTVNLHIYICTCWSYVL